jgi:hypothetical protein
VKTIDLAVLTDKVRFTEMKLFLMIPQTAFALLYHLNGLVDFIRIRYFWFYKRGPNDLKIRGSNTKFRFFP